MKNETYLVLAEIDQDLSAEIIDSTEDDFCDDYIANAKDLNDSQKEAVDKWWSTKDIENYDYMTGFRYATVGNRSQERYYQNIVEGECCGFVDVVLDCFDGTKLMYGFNYGH